VSLSSKKDGLVSVWSFTGVIVTVNYFSFVLKTQLFSEY